jgi:hypothetical protein
MKNDDSLAKGARSHEGCDVKPVVQDGSGDALDVRLEPTAEDLVEALEGDTEHVLSVEQWAERLRQLDARAFGDRPKPRQAALVQPGTEAKIAIMRERIARGEDPFGPRDLEDGAVPQAGRDIQRVRNGRDKRLGYRKLTDPKGGAA